MLQKLFVLAVMALAFNGSQALAAKAFPTTWTEFTQLSQKDMKSLPDMKWAMDKVPTADELKGKNEVELALFRNSIYAQNGFRFTEPALVRYFTTRSWYHPAQEEMMPLSEKARTAAHMFMQAQSTTMRGVAGDNSYSPEAYDVYTMGFCTYDTKYEHPGGILVFEAGGTARVYHSVGSSPYSQGVNAYSALAQPRSPKSRLIEGKWSVSGDGKVYVDIPAASVPLEREEESGKEIPGKYTFAPGKREVLDTNNYQSLSNHRCTMNIVKK